MSGLGRADVTAKLTREYSTPLRYLGRASQYESMLDVAHALVGVQAQLMPATLGALAVRIR